MDGEGISDGLSAERKVEIRVNKNGRKVIFSDKPFFWPVFCMFCFDFSSFAVSYLSVKFFESRSLLVSDVIMIM